jgi:hypothetical protein
VAASWLQPVGGLDVAHQLKVPAAAAAVTCELECSSTSNL